VDAEIINRSKIAALVSKLTVLGDDGDFHGMSKMFSPEGTFGLGSNASAVGPDAISRMLSEFSASLTKRPNGPTYMRHHLTTAVIELDGENDASADTYFLNFNERGLDHWGRFRDRLKRDATGEWLFTRRETIEEGKAENSFLNTP